jgi:hypothetical protein
MENKTSKGTDMTKKLDDFLGEDTTKQTIECKDDVCIIKNDKSIVERVHKTVITQDGRQLLT